MNELTSQALGRIVKVNVDLESKKIEEDTFFIEFEILYNFSDIVRIAEAEMMPGKLKLMNAKGVLRTVSGL